MTATILPTIHADAASYIEQHGWAQGVMEDEQGRVCLTGALRKCSPQPGDWTIAREVYRARGFAEDWNDDEAEDAAEVVDYLTGHPVTDEDLAATFGFQWRAVVTLVRQAAALTGEQAEAIATAWGAARGASRNSAANAARGAARGTAWVLVVADLVGEYGLEQHHIDTLLNPWISVMGDPREVTA